MSHLKDITAVLGFVAFIAAAVVCVTAPEPEATVRPPSCFHFQEEDFQAPAPCDGGID